MKLGQGVEWGIHCAVVLARAPEGALVSTRMLAEHFALPETYLAKHLQAMARAGLLQGTTGPRGGFRLARPAEQISVLHVVEAIEGTAPPFVCQEIRQRGTGCVPAQDCTEPCAVNAVMTAAHEAWRDSLRSVSVADIQARLPEGVRTPFA